MKSRQVIVLLSAALLLNGCDPADLFLSPEDSAQMTFDHKDQRYDTEQVRVMISELQSVWNSDREDTVSSLIDGLTAAADDAAAVFHRAEMQYYADWENKDLSDLHDQTKQDYYEVVRMVNWAFANGSRKSRYAELFKSLLNSDDTDYYLANSLSRVSSNARSEANRSGERLDDYYDTVYRTDSTVSESNDACAKLYLATLEEYDTSDYLYPYYSRDYTASDVSAAYQEILRSFVPVYDAVQNTVQSDSRYEQLAAGRFAVEKPFDVIGTYAAGISPQLDVSIRKLLDESLYTVATGSKCYDGCYTVNFPRERSARIYLFQAGDYYDFCSAVHEFGHFHSDWRDTTPSLLQETCVDIAEIQSQGLEMLFTHYYDEIYGSDAAFLELIQIYNMLDSVVTGFSVGEFEKEVMQHKEEYSAEDVRNTFEQYRSKSGFPMELYQITHLYEQPGYYISYGVSALAALQIYVSMLSDFALGSDLYEKISEVPTFSGEYQLRGALKQCGFPDVFSPETMQAVAESILARVDALTDR